MTAAAQLSPVDETSALLTQWARWARQGNGLGNLLWPGQTPFQRLRGSTVPTAAISDPAAAEVDYCVSRLAELDKEAGAVVIKHFLLGKSIRRISREEKLTSRAVSIRLNAGVAWIAGRLDREEC
jgi:DNA-directed RNA polymerase specialized sigma24 family protein